MRAAIADKTRRAPLADDDVIGNLSRTREVTLFHASWSKRTNLQSTLTMHSSQPAFECAATHAVRVVAVKTEANLVQPLLGLASSPPQLKCEEGQVIDDTLVNMLQAMLYHDLSATQAGC